MFDLFNEGNKPSEIRKKSNLAGFRGKLLLMILETLHSLYVEISTLF
jgi:hypothetical protein